MHPEFHMFQCFGVLGPAVLLFWILLLQFPGVQNPLTTVALLCWNSALWSPVSFVMWQVRVNHKRCSGFAGWYS